MSITRPIIRYHGGKYRLAPWIISHLPEHRTYVEPYGGGASVLLRKPRSYAEVYNDLDGEIVNLFTIARDRGEELALKCELTPFSRDEFTLSYQATLDPVEQARRTLIRGFMGFGSPAASGGRTGFRANSNRSGTTPAHDWMNWPASFRAVIDRLRGVVIENRDAIVCMKQHDAPTTLHYVDPPYVHGTRFNNVKNAVYRHEMTDEQHIELLQVLQELSGMVVLSGYMCELYGDLLNGWTRIDKGSFADGARARTETLWLSPNIKQVGLFAQEVA